MERRDPRTFIEAALKDADLDETLRTRLVEIATQKPGGKRVAALVEAFERDDEGR